MPKDMALEADAFDVRHQACSFAADRLCVGMREQLLTGRAWRQDDPKLFERARFAVQWNRYTTPQRPEQPAMSSSPRKKKKKAPLGSKPNPKKVFNLPDSIWGPRAETSDSRSYFDTDEVEWKRFNAGVECLLEMGLSKLVLMYDDDEEPGDEDGDGIPDEVEDVLDVLWENHAMLHSLFHFYGCANGAKTGRFDQLSLNTWTEMTSDFELCSKASKCARRSDVDRIFVAANAMNDPSCNVRPDAKRDSKHQLSELQFYCALIRLAIAKFVMPRVIEDVSEALKQLLEAELLGRLGSSGATGGCFLDKDGFRRRHCYTDATNQVLREHEASLRNLFDAVSSSHKDGRQSRAADSLLSLDEWLGFVHAAELIGSDASIRDATMCFAWSRMTVIDGRKGARQAERASALPFEGFCEALCRLSALKALPTRAELEEAGVSSQDCAAYLLRMQRDDSATWQKLLRQRSAAWGAEPLMPVHESLRMVLYMIEGCVEEATRGKDDACVTKAEAVEWVRKRMCK